jgi:hypothetical protein
MMQQRILAILFLTGSALLGAIVSGCAAGNPPSRESMRSDRDAPVRLIIRSDDMGFSHGANVANRRLMASGLPVNVSVLFTGPWYKEAVAILKAHPEVSVGVHLCANSEWKHYKWGPVASTDRVPSLVTEDGYFYGSYRALNIEHTPDVDEMEIEFRAQIERALGTGLPIDYLDNHMGAGMHTPEQRAMVEGLARTYNLPISGYYGEHRPGSFSGGDYAAQLSRLIGLIDRMPADSLNRLVFHLGTDTPELQAMQDLNENGVKRMSVQRQIEQDLLLSDAFRAALRRNNVQLVTYRGLAQARGVQPSAGR